MPALWAILEALGVAWAVKEGPGGPYVQGSEGFLRLMGRPAPQWGQLSDTDFLSPDDAAAMRRGDVQCLGLQQAHATDLRLQLQERFREMTLVRMPLGDGCLVTAWLDRTEDRRLAQQLQRAIRQIEQHQDHIESLRQELHAGTQRDTSTGLHANAQFEAILQRELDLSRREQREFSLVALSFGQGASAPPNAEARQRQFEALGRLLRQNTRAMDVAFHLEGECFAVLLSGVGLATAYQRMEQLRRQADQQLVVWEGQDLGLPLVMGVASFPLTASTAEGLMKAARSALQKAQPGVGPQTVMAPIEFSTAHAEG